ncbi:MAG: hypothetical protein AAGF25_04405 [Pseudomonadota bacterium]
MKRRTLIKALPIAGLAAVSAKPAITALTDRNKLTAMIDKHADLRTQLATALDEFQKAEIAFCKHKKKVRRLDGDALLLVQHPTALACDVADDKAYELISANCNLERDILAFVCRSEAELTLKRDWFEDHLEPSMLDRKDVEALLVGYFGQISNA